MKYKIGDKVKVRSDLEQGEEYGCYEFIDDMEPLRGTTVTIAGLLSDCYGVTEDAGDCGWTDEMFEGGGHQ